MLPALLLVVLCGCGPGYQFSPYAGVQQNWQTGAGGYVKQVKGADLYMPGQFPVRPYVILGSVSTDSYEGVARAVHEHHADAALVYTDSTVRTGTVDVAGPGVIWGVPLTSHTVNAQLITFK